MALTKEQFSELRSKGLTIDQIVRFERGEKPTRPVEKEKQTFFQSIVNGEVPAALENKGKVDLLSFPKTAASFGLGVAQGAGRLLARPFTELTRGVRQAVPGGKTGEEAINVPLLGEFEKPTVGKGLLEAGEAALTFLPAEKLLSPIINYFKKLKPEIKTVDEAVNGLVGKITQAKPKDLNQVKKALNEVDTSGVKTYSDLKTAAKDSITSLSEAQDELLGGVKEVYDINKFSKQLAGEEQNFIKDAFKGLEEHYRKSNDLAKLDELLTLKNKAESTGITINEINSLARKYSADMPSAFTATGEASTSVTKQAYENTRKGLKETFRNALPSEIKDSSIMLDDKVSSLYRLKDYSSKMEDKVQVLYNKVNERGLLEQLARKLGQAADLATFKTVSGFTKSFVVPSNVGLKVMNSIDLEKQLANNLTKLDNLLNSSMSDEKFLDEVAQLIIQNAAKQEVKNLTE